MSQKNKALIMRTEITGSPFVMVKHNSKWFLTMGKYRLSNETFDTEDECLEWLEANKWNVIGTMCGIICEYNINENKQLKIKENDNN